MYELARAGEDVERDPRRVHVSQFTISRTSHDTPDEDTCCQSFKYFIICSKGTYVRSLIHDLV